MKLYLVRHGEAPKGGSAGSSDAVRPLTDRGEEDVAAMGKFLNRADGGVRRILASPLARAQKTGEILASFLGDGVRVKPTDNLAPGFRSRPLLDEIAGLAEEPSIVLVGHQPDLSILLSSLIGGGSPGAIGFSPGAAAAVEYDPGSRVGKATLVWFLSPETARRFNSI